MKPMTAYSVAELLPHGGDMILLDDVLDGSDQFARAALTVRGDGLFDDGAGRVPAWVGIEYMAQAIALWIGYNRLCRGLEVELGFLLGTRRYETNVEHLAVGARLEASAHLLLMEETGLGAFECHLEGEGVAISARINAFQPDDVEQYLAPARG